ncbi:MAG: hypothetical protein MZV64_71615 [Ignavibacteriales bacterium]|nr:hypothetical protein [Ignavibacteriales bacterium]
MIEVAAKVLVAALRKKPELAMRTDAPRFLCPVANHTNTSHSEFAMAVRKEFFKDNEGHLRELLHYPLWYSGGTSLFTADGL